jgi:hypothetical protein
MNAATAQPQNPPAHVGMFQLLNGIAVAGVVSCVAELGIPDLVDGGAKSVEELAQATGANVKALYRLMRASACVGVLTEGADGKFSQTPLSAVLRSNATPSLRAFAIMHGREWHARGWARLTDSVRTGERELEKIYNMSAFEYFREHAEEGKIFNQAMTDLSSIDGPAVTEAYDFSGIGSIVDIAGGHGLLLATILGRNPHMKGTLYDLPHVVDGAKNGALKPVMERCALASGDMFASVPGGADAYIMKHIIHDWPDAECVQILQACRRAVNPGGKLLVVDTVIPSGNDFYPGKFLDILMMLFPGGRERTEKEFRELFTASGWKLNRVIPTNVVECIVEGVPA